VRRCVRSLYAFCDMRSRYYEGEALFGLARQGLVPAPGEAPHSAWTLSLLSWYDLMPYTKRPEIFEETASQAQNCLSGARATDDAEGVACSLVLLGAVVGDRGEYQTAIGHYQQAMQIHPPLDDFYWVNMRIGLAYQSLEQYPDALRSFRASLARGKVLGERVKIGWSLLNLGDTLAMTGENVEAGNHLREALELFEAIGTSVGIMWAKYSLARLALVEGKREMAKQLADQTFALAEQTRLPSWTDKISALLREITPDAGHRIARPSLPEPLSEREMEILQLLKSDLNGPEIARALTVSLNTVRFHTKNIYRKLQVDSRREAVHRAEELGL
jgi:DNA-binding CsgD family transcriptional regulator